MLFDNIYRRGMELENLSQYPDFSTFFKGIGISGVYRLEAALRYPVFFKSGVCEEKKSPDTPEPGRQEWSQEDKSGAGKKQERSR